MKNQTPPTVTPVSASTDTALGSRARLESLSRLMDSSIRLPGGYRIGWDGIIGLIPGFGDLAGLAVSLYIIAGAQRAGASRATLLRMGLNVGIETVIGAIPLAGDIFDMAFKANNRNMKLLNREMQDPVSTARKSKLQLWSTLALCIALFCLAGYLIIATLAALLSFIF